MLKNELRDGGKDIMPSIRRKLGRIDVLRRVCSDKWRYVVDGCLGDYFDFFITTVELEPKPISVELYSN